KGSALKGGTVELGRDDPAEPLGAAPAQVAELGGALLEQEAGPLNGGGPRFYGGAQVGRLVELPGEALTLLDGDLQAASVLPLHLLQGGEPGFNGLQAAGIEVDGVAVA